MHAGSALIIARARGSWVYDEFNEVVLHGELCSRVVEERRRAAVFWRTLVMSIFEGARLRRSCRWEYRLLLFPGTVGTRIFENFDGA